MLQHSSLVTLNPIKLHFIQHVLFGKSHDEYVNKKLEALSACRIYIQIGDRLGRKSCIQCLDCHYKMIITK